jgi:hypothetical protein
VKTNRKIIADEFLMLVKKLPRQLYSK